MDNGIYKNAITSILGLNVGEQSGAWVVKDDEQWRELTTQELADVQVEYERMYKESVVPKSITMRQARLALNTAGLLTTIEESIALMPKEVQIEWEYASEVLRNSPTIASFASALSLSEDQIDQLFIDGSQL